MPHSFTSSAPGSLMLLGEHAVLYGKLALVCAVNRRIRVRLTPRADDKIVIESALGRHETTLAKVKPVEPFRFVNAVIVKRREHIKKGFDLAIESEFSHEVGLGSSAAVTVATASVLGTWLRDAVTELALFGECVQVVREVQGMGSGADVAASVYGGIVSYRATPLEIEPLDGKHPITVVYSGMKTPTPEVVRRVEGLHKAWPDFYDTVFSLMDRSAMDGAAAVKAGDWKRLGAILNANQGLMAAIGVGTAKLAEIVYALRADPGILGAKISGSGLGDCAIGLGKAKRTDWPYTVIPAEIAKEGVKVE